ncbi:hypothetical protein L0B52_03665 [Suttonella sp. R2A3]|uniref:hypothetical protein n=1 Tax=Suttonella sp. R2A3 TaxID=2908648 RepID=UPI001F38F682|nr:hypothetical protein [Suttonella sp. R2A3]UJF25258.1 hypothetical protein L0B52_03665 [Suttonella sp. R2A3]
MMKQEQSQLDIEACLTDEELSHLRDLYLKFKKQINITTILAVVMMGSFPLMRQFMFEQGELVLFLGFMLAGCTLYFVYMNFVSQRALKEALRESAAKYQLDKKVFGQAFERTMRREVGGPKVGKL